MPLDELPERLTVPGLGAANERLVVRQGGLRAGHTVYRGLRRHPGWEK